MRYVLIIYQPHPFDPKALPADEHRAIAQQYGELTALPNVEPGLPLGRVEDAVTVRLADGEPRPAPGPFMGPGGAAGGYLVLGAATVDEAVAIAARIPAVRLGGAVEIRQAQAYW